MTGHALTDANILQIGMADIALLAKVRRAVVTTWRSRYADSDHPFPDPIPAEHGPAMFAAADVAAWLHTTNRGNNPQAADDIAAFATVADASPRTDRTAFDAVSALLCLYAVTGRALDATDGDALLDAADAVDPDDRYLYREVEAAAERVLPLARYANLLVDAVGGPAGAFETLLRDRFRSGLAEHTTTTVDQRALTLTARIAVELTAPSGEPVSYSDPSPGSSDLLLAVLREHGDRGLVEVLTPRSDDSASRLVRRRLRAHDVYRERLPLDDGVPELDRPVTHVTCLPAPGRPVTSAADLLTQIEAIAVPLDYPQRAVVLGPASVLCDSPADPESTPIRDALLRAGHVVAIVRLPAGLVTVRSRQRLAVWILGPAAYRRSSETFTYVADLVNVSLTPAVIDDLVTDLLAATGGRELHRAHAPRFVRSVATRLLIPPGRSLVERGAVTAAPDPTSAAELVIRANDTAHQLGAPWPTAALPELTVRRDRGVAATSTVEDALTAGHLRSMRGNRLRGEDVGRGAGLPVLGVAELLGSSRVGARSIGQFAFARYDTGRLTQPGDVVFCTGPRPRAMVDPTGASVVESPARVLRIDAGDPGGVHAEVLAADINDQPATARAWRLWPVRRVPEETRPGFDALLREVARIREDLRVRERLLDQFAQTVTDGVTAGQLGVAASSAETSHHPTKGR